MEDIPGMLRVLDSYMLTDCKSLYDALVRVERRQVHWTEFVAPANHCGHCGAGLEGAFADNAACAACDAVEFVE